MGEAQPDLDVVTGGFGYTGKYIARRLLSLGRKVRTLTGHPQRLNPFGSQVEIRHLDFDDSAELCRSLEGGATLYNTYWIRFEHGRSTFARAVANTEKLVRAAGTAGIHRVVHISIANPAEDSPLPYFRGKAMVEKIVRGSGLHWAIIRPTVIFGKEDILINNIAWLLRHSPIFAVPGSGDYRLQPIFVDDVAALAIRAAQEPSDRILDAVGPEVFTFSELVRLIAAKIHSRAKIIYVTPALALISAKVLGWLVRDVILTRDEVIGLMRGLLISSEAPTGRASFTDWLEENAALLGTKYASELGRHYR